MDRFPVRKPMPRAQFDALSREILVLKKQLNAVILAHNYQVPEIQDVADYVGDSLGLSQQAAQTKADVIVFSGVHFMAETAKILSPDKIVVLPDKDAGCSLEESCPADKLAEFQKTNPNFYTVTYINCSAAVKALSDVICTSGNAVKIVNASPKDKDLLFVPGREPRRVGDGADGPAHDALAGQLLRARGVPPGEPAAREAVLSRRPRWSCIPRACTKCASWPMRCARPRR